MARILVAGAHASLAQQRLLSEVVTRLRRDGHDAVTWQDAQEGAARAIRDADALVALLDDLPTEAAAAVAMADALDKPCLGLATRGRAGPLLAELTHLVEAEEESTWWASLPGFYDRIRPFAGRVVRDRIPELVREAGHQIAFRSLDPDERPRFLKQKIATEAKELLSADLAKEKEEVADLLEALEAFILSRGFDRDDLRRIKEHKKKQRGGFERGFVVEATARTDGSPNGARRPAGGPGGDDVARPRQADARLDAQRIQQGEPGANPEPAGHRVATGEQVDFEFDDAEPAEPQRLDDVAAGREVRGKFFEI